MICSRRVAGGSSVPGVQWGRVGAEQASPTGWNAGGRCLLTVLLFVMLLAVGMVVAVMVS
jgi:hypothetical protein